MTQAIVDSIGYSHEGALPDWMTSPQENNKPLGFVNAVVLAYTVPGASKLMAYRVNTRGLEFNTIDFVVDRYQLDNHLSTNFNVSINSFMSSAETTWDRITKEGIIRHSATYAVSGLPFDSALLKEHLKNLKKKHGCNGSIKDDVLQFQGDQIDNVEKYFNDLGINEITINSSG
jgi:translation initiation factor 1 (eIF-1/SUI1)